MLPCTHVIYLIDTLHKLNRFSHNKAETTGDNEPTTGDNEPETVSHDSTPKPSDGPVTGQELRKRVLKTFEAVAKAREVFRLGVVSFFFLGDRTLFTSIIG